jgi:hypothetical protein
VQIARHTQCAPYRLLSRKTRPSVSPKGPKTQLRPRLRNRIVDCAFFFVFSWIPAWRANQPILSRWQSHVQNHENGIRRGRPGYVHLLNSSTIEHCSLCIGLLMVLTWKRTSYHTPMATRFVKSDTLSISVPHSCLRTGSDFESCSTSTSASRICAVWNLSGFRQSIQHSHRVLLDVYRKTSRRNVDHFRPQENVSNRQDNLWVHAERSRLEDTEKWQWDALRGMISD